MTTTTIELHDATIELGGRAILEGVSIRIAAGERIAVMGPSGAGKSTLARAVVGLERLSRGTISIDGAVATDGRRIVIPAHDRAVGMVFQDLALWPHLTVAGQLAFVLGASRMPAAARDQRIASALAEVGLAALAARRPHELSGGEQQRVALARALITRPRLLVLDEPLTGLDAVRRPEIRALLRQLAAGTTIVHVTHDPRDVAGDVDRVVVLEAGRVTQDATPAALRAAPATAFACAIAPDLAPGD